MKEEDLRVGSFVVYPTHGLGEIISIGTVSYGELMSKVVSIKFIRERMVLKVPISRIIESGLRLVHSREQMHNALQVLSERVRVRRTMWSRRAQEYQTKINSGNPKAIAEVCRELFRDESSGTPSFSEHQIYQQALSRLAYEYAVIEQIDFDNAANTLEKMMQTAA